jgi:leucyl aminopeptidase (aminopeptidase T)
MAIDLLSRADLVVDLQHLSWAYTDSQARVRQALDARGGRIVTLHGRHEDVFHLTRCTPDATLSERTLRAKTYVDAAHLVHVTSSLGTDLAIQRGHPRERPSFCPPGQAAFAPPDDGVDGILCFVGGVRVQAPRLRTHMVYEPVRVEIARGKIVAIHRENASAVMLDEWFRSHRDPGAYHFAHVNLGLDPRVELHRLDNLSVHFNYGGILMGFGVNYTPLFGSTVKAPSHIEMALTGASYAVDGRPLLVDGEFTEDSGLRVAQ